MFVFFFLCVCVCLLKWAVAGGQPSSARLYGHSGESRWHISPKGSFSRWHNLLGGSSQDGRKWLITMVSYKSPKWGCGTPDKWPKWPINGGDPNHLLSGGILQVLYIPKDFTPLVRTFW